MGRRSTYGDGVGAGARDEGRWLVVQRATIARGLCEDAAAQPTSLLLEQWASMVLGWFWERRKRMGGRPLIDLLATSGEPVLRSIAEVGSAEAKLALVALGRIDRGALGLRARQLAEQLSWLLPPRVGEVGTGRLVQAFHTSSAGDGEVVMLRSDGTGPRAHMVAVYIDARHGWLAKHVALVRSFDPLRPDTPEDAAWLSLKFRPADLAAMRLKVGQAIERTDAAVNPPVDESFSRYRGIALARLSPLDN